MGDLFLEDVKIRPFCDKIRILALKKKKKKIGDTFLENRM